MQVDFNGIESSINNAVRNIRNNSLEEAAYDFAEYINKGTKAPGYARIAQNVAVENSARFWDKEVYEGRIALNDAKKLHLGTGLEVNKFWDICKDEAEAFKDSFKKLYPRTWKKRLSIEAFLHEVNGEVKPASDMKAAKKMVLFMRKFTNKMF